MHVWVSCMHTPIHFHINSLCVHVHVAVTSYFLQRFECKVYKTFTDEGNHRLPKGLIFILLCLQTTLPQHEPP